MKTHWIDRVKLSLLIIGLACIGFSTWRLNSSRTPPMPHEGGVWDLGLLPMDSSMEGSITASRSLSDWVESHDNLKQFVLKWRYPDPNSSSGWCQRVYTYTRSNRTLKVEWSRSSAGPQVVWVYNKITDGIIWQVAINLRTSLLNQILVRELGCSLTETDINTGETRTYPPR
jgi:hypothetical protein